MNLLQMSFSGAVLILAVVVVRALTIHKLPKQTFLVLWGVVLFRLLIPFSVPSAFSVYSFAGQRTPADILPQMPTDHTVSIVHMGNQKTVPQTAFDTGSKESGIRPETQVLSANDVPSVSIWFLVWGIGMTACITYFTVSYLRWRFEFQTSLPVCNDYAQRWLKDHPLRRPVSIRQSDRISTPLTYGIFRPVILMPKSTDWENTEQLKYILLHEYVHICRFDVLTKLVCTLALCVHWFNPAVWVMSVLFNQDMELSCDECVVRRLGETSKSPYAHVLIHMEAERSGLMPFCNNFSKNAIEERIRAIMKMKKTSLLAAVMAAVVIIGVTIAFATSAADKTENNSETASSETEKTAENSNTDSSEQEKTAGIPGTDSSETEKTIGIPGTDSSEAERATAILDAFTEEEYAQLLALRFDGYEDMSISGYQNKIWTLTDTVPYNKLLERVSVDEALYESKDSDEMASYLFYILEPLTGDLWQRRSFGGYAATDYPIPSDNATLEYILTLTILDENALTVGEYDNARQGAVLDLKNILQNVTAEMLVDEETMQTVINEEIENITRTYGSDRMQLAVEYTYLPLGGYMDWDMEKWEREQTQKECDRVLLPYVPFGLTYHCDFDSDDYIMKMYYQGKQVRGIYDEHLSIWISEHQGIGEGIYSEQAIELFAVYDDGKLVGLREGSAQEQEEWAARRQEATDSWQGFSQEVRMYAPATEEDYQSLLALKTPDYQKQLIADFNQDILDWGNEDFERAERISGDRSWKDCRVSLSDEESSFVTLTAALSEMENRELVRSLYKKAPEQDVQTEIFLEEKEAYGDNDAPALPYLYYSFSYHISDKETVSVGERDACVGGFLNSVQKFWNETSLDARLRMTDADILKKLHEIEARYSNSRVTITVLDAGTRF